MQFASLNPILGEWYHTLFVHAYQKKKIIVHNFDQIVESDCNYDNNPQ